MNNNIDEIIQVINDSKSICILTHKNPDPDAMGSCLGLYTALNLINKSVSILVQNIPSTLTYLVKDIEIKSEISDFDLCIALDCGDTKIMYDKEGVFSKIQNTMNIDHHKTNESYAKYNYVQPSASATGEILYDIIEKLTPISAKVAECLYTAILGDTGGFKFSNTTSRTLNIASALVTFGVDVARINKNIFDQISKNKLKLLAQAIESLELYNNDKIAIMTVVPEELQQLNMEESECDSIVNYTTNIKGVEVGMFLKLRPEGEVKVSLRSNNYVDVATIAKGFGGGGHERASGCTISGSLEDAKQKLLMELDKHIK